ncbi:hypothetical protein GCM10017620_09100 [Brevundimonas intermedia]|uniref:DUF3617 family protein n=1 Tax=Brevundimonas intermedia TaxID=74315 RepID=A0ABQ5T718_9CAUL|nr:hypothetical protein [Brevundimonas intermedia]GLK47937.1 hypothetical protein GCM10017620_09100 [Brevundimonas intermedia]
MRIRHALTAVALVATSACEANTDRWIERQTAVDPPELWQVEALGADVQPVRICVDGFLRKGFSAPLPEVNGRPCIPMGKSITTPDATLQRCTLGHEDVLVRVTRTGDDDVFTVALRVTLISGHKDASAVQTRRYTRLGACPKGWKVGDVTDQKGRRTNEVWPPVWR